MRYVLPSELQSKSTLLKEKQDAIAEVVSEVQQKETQRDVLIQKIEKLKEEQDKIKDCKLML